MTKYDAIGRALQARLDELSRRVNKMEAQLRQPLDADMDQQSIDIEGDEALEALEDVERDEIRHIRSALSRIAGGTYGTCATCGVEIAPERLKAMPTALQCIACAKQAG